MAFNLYTQTHTVIMVTVSLSLYTHMWDILLYVLHYQ